MTAPPNLTTRYLGLEMPSPILAASCGLTNSVENIRECERAGAGAVVLKSLFEEQILAEVGALVEASRDSLWHPEAADYLRAHGEADAVGKYLALIREAKQAVGIPVIASVHCVSAQTWTDFARRIEDAGADALELNVFVLPSDPRRSAAENEQIYFDLVGEMKRRVSLPIALKISHYFSSLAQTLQRLGRSGAAGLVLFNRFHRPDLDIEALRMVPAPYYSDPREIHLPLRWVAIASGFVECDLAATTGVHDGAGAVKLLLAGATAVQVASALYRNGIGHLATMNAQLAAWMERHGFETIDSFRGHLSQASSGSPASYERVQFMKMSVGIE